MCQFKRISMKAVCLISCGILAANFMTGCSEDGKSPLEPHIELIEQTTARDALVLANKMRVSNPDVRSVLKADAVTFVFSEGHEVSVPLPDDTMAIAVAPYIVDTHPCAIHSISGCKAELVGVEVRVLAEAYDGTVLMDDTLVTGTSGFIELWLPRDIEIDLTLVAQGKLATGKITTYDTSDTCVTTFKLE